MDQMMLFLEIMLINIVLSGDNAVIIAMASHKLPQKQRKAVVWWGTGGAIVLRLFLTIGAVYLLRIPYVQVIGAVLLLYIAFKLLSEDQSGTKIQEAATLSSAISAVLVADLVMSLDNVLAVAAIAGGNLYLLVLGIIMSFPLIIWGSSFVMHLLQRFPLLIYIGSGVLAYTAGDMLVNDGKIRQWLFHAHASYAWVVPIACVIAVIAGGWISQRWFGEGTNP